MSLVEPIHDAPYRTFFQASPDPMWIFDAESLRFLEVNPAAISLYGYTRAEFLSMSILDIRPDREVQAVIDDLAKPHDPASGPWTHTLKDGTDILVKIFAIPMEYDGRPARAVIVRDVTAETGAKEELEAWNETLERKVAERTAELVAANQELEGFCSSVSHDLRTPLRAIDGFTRAILEDYGSSLDETGQSYLQRVRAASWRMSELIDDLLGLTRLTRTPISREPVDLGRMAKDIFERFRTSVPERAVEFQCTSDRIVDGDARQLKKLLEVLLDNAWKFTSRSRDAKIEFRADVEDGRCVFSVIDNGVGFDMAYVERLFRPFERLHSTEEFPGNGIGLATASRIVTRHGGTIWATGQPGAGATLKFTLCAKP